MRICWAYLGGAAIGSELLLEDGGCMYLRLHVCIMASYMVCIDVTLSTAAQRICVEKLYTRLSRLLQMPPSTPMFYPLARPRCKC